MPSVTVSQAFAMALQHHRAGRWADAEALYRQILGFQPQHAEALHYLGVLAHQRGDHGMAIQQIQQALQLAPDNAAAYSNLGEALRHAGRLDEAAAHFRRALELNPNLPDARLNLGNVLGDGGRIEEAIVEYQRALAIAPNHARAWCALGGALERRHDFAGAERNYRQAIALSPRLTEAHVNLSALLLRQGLGKEGWQEHEWRRRFTASPERFRTFPLESEWHGESMERGALFLYAEQGLGDTLQFLRYLPAAKERTGAAQVILACQLPLVPLLRQLEGTMVDLVVSDAERSEWPAFDRHLPLLSLPLALEKFEPLEMAAPYLKGDEGRRSRWRTQFDSSRAGRIGLAWRGNPAHGNDRRRSLLPELLAPLLRRTDVEWVSLQFDLTLPLPAIFTQAGTKDFSSAVADFADSAALVAELDLIITVDTATAHLAGALGRPVWLLLSHLPDWRWGVEGERTLWYPTMRIFRQRAPGAWEPVLENVARALAGFRPERA